MPPDSQDTLTTLRARIRAKDEEILRVVAERLELAREIGAIKMQQNMPIKDDRTEQDVLTHARQSAKKLGVYSALAEQITTLLMRYAVIAQDENLSRAQAQHFAGTGVKRAITVIGGCGRMGMWLANFLASYGHDITLWDQPAAPAAHPSTNGSSRPHKIAKNLPAAISDADIVILATPISATAGIIKALSDLKTSALVLDICSLKSPLLEAINEARTRGIRVASAHPMFGPDVEVLAGRHIVICDTGDRGATEECRALFAVSTAKIVTIPLVEHDRLMGQVLGQSHLCNLVFTRALEHSSLSYADLSSVSSTTFGAQIQVTRAVAAENPDLYFEIQHANTQTAEVIKGMRTALAEYEAVIAKGDRSGFVRLMTSGRDYLGLAGSKTRS